MLEGFKGIVSEDVSQYTAGVSYNSRNKKYDF
jgi:hypothetical protein